MKETKAKLSLHATRFLDYTEVKMLSQGYDTFIQFANS
jgi:hypothetical protein